uniref:Secreted protein n=1 Tax=Stegastes partitus TaxID=144197 RepID=A0A3B5A0G4_9TELE
MLKGQITNLWGFCLFVCLSVLQMWGLCPFHTACMNVCMTYSVHVDAVGVGPGVLEILLQSLSQASWDLVETDELFDPQHLRVVASRAGVKSLDDG